MGVIFAKKAKVWKLPPREKFHVYIYASVLIGILFNMWHIDSVIIVLDHIYLEDDILHQIFVSLKGIDLTQLIVYIKTYLITHLCLKDKKKQSQCYCWF